MVEYVLVHAAAENDLTSVLVVYKQKPAWQKNRYNLVGGKVEEGETPEQAAIRELKEETGLDALSTMYLGKILAGQNDEATVHCLHCLVKKDRPQPRPEETEVTFWTDFAFIKNDERLMPNLRVIIPMMIMGLKDWVVYDHGPSWDKERHQFSVEVKSDKAQT